jgi:hypothetical protein
MKKDGLAVESEGVLVQELVQIDFPTCADEYPFIHMNFWKNINARVMWCQRIPESQIRT